MTKTCSKCSEVKVLEDFHRNANRADGRVAHCKPCVAEYAKRYAENNSEKMATSRRLSYEKNREEVLAYRRRYVQENREKVKESNRLNYAKNKDARTAYRKQYREENREAIAEGKRRYAEENHEKVKESHQRWSNQNRERVRELGRRSYDKNREKRAEYGRRYRLATVESRRARAARRRARKRAATVEVFTYDELLAHYAAMGYVGCAYCGGPHEHDDHIVPLSQGGAHSRENLAPACACCNLSKGTKLLAEWLGFIA